MPDDHPHEPVIATGVGEFRKHYIVCATCGKLLWFVPLEDLGVNTADWSAREYEHAGRGGP